MHQEQKTTTEYAPEDLQIAIHKSHDRRIVMHRDELPLHRLQYDEHLVQLRLLPCGRRGGMLPTYFHVLPEMPLGGLLPERLTFPRNS